MNVDEFVFALKKDIANFQTNLSGRVYETEEEWMEAFLRWMEWKTDMHKEYWGEKFAP